MSDGRGYMGIFVLQDENYPFNCETILKETVTEFEKLRGFASDTFMA